MSQLSEAAVDDLADGRSLFDSPAATTLFDQTIRILQSGMAAR